jgi:hypothetical protein
MQGTWLERTILSNAVEGHVLVKNVKNVLPLKSPKILSIYGYDAKTLDVVQVASSTITQWKPGYEGAGITRSFQIPFLISRLHMEVILFNVA